MCNSISFSGDSLQGATSIAIARTTSRVAGATFARNCTAKEFFGRGDGDLGSNNARY